MNESKEIQRGKFKRSQKGIQKLPRDKWKYDNPKPNIAKLCSKKEVYSNTLIFREMCPTQWDITSSSPKCQQH